jgi:galactokinase
MKLTDLPNDHKCSDHAVAEEFRKRFGGPARVFFAPGRVNLIGEHTDYNDGFVMPAALAFYTYVAAGLRSDDKLSVYSIDFDETREFGLPDIVPGPTANWSDYVRGVAAVMRSRGIPIGGANLVIKGEVPIGAGLSSSAALEVATATALLGLHYIQLARREIAAICQLAEHDYAGTKCGIMDQFISCFGEADHAILLDCRSLDFEPLPINERVRIVICNTMVKHELAAGEYNRRRVECEAGVHHLQRFLPDIRALRDVSASQFVTYGSDLPDVIRRRCRHVIGENARVLEAAEALRGNDLKRPGELMAQSHLSLRNDYEVSCDELDLMVSLANKCRGVYGARMTGGGFGGCTVNLVEKNAVEDFKTTVAGEYQQKVGLQPDIYVCAAADGAQEIKIQVS